MRGVMKRAFSTLNRRDTMVAKGKVRIRRW